MCSLTLYKEKEWERHSGNNNNSETLISFLAPFRSSTATGFVSGTVESDPANGVAEFAAGVPLEMRAYCVSVMESAARAPRG